MGVEEKDKAHAGVSGGVSGDGTEQVIDLTSTSDGVFGGLPRPEPAKPSPLLTASWFSRVTFGQVTPMLLLGSKRQLQPDDMWELEHVDHAEVMYPLFVREWARDVQDWKTREKDPKRPPRPNMFRTLLRMYKKELITTAMLSAVYATTSVSGPQIMRKIIEYIAGNTMPEWQGWTFAVLFAIVPFVGSLCWGHAFLQGFRLGMRIRAIVTMAVYRKSLRLSTAARQDPAMSQGKIVTLMSIDSQSFLEGIAFLHFAWVSPTIIFVIIGLLYNLLGPSALAGVGVMLVLFPVSGTVAAKSMALTFKQKKQTDQRVTVLSEILQGIRIIKFYAWEPSFVDKVGAVRNHELAMLWRLMLLRAVNTFLLYATPMLTSIATFLTYTLTGNTVTPQVVFPTIALFAAMRFPLGFIPFVISNLVKMNIARVRVTDFLLADEVEEEEDEATIVQDASQYPVCVTDGQFYWLTEKKDSTDHSTPPGPKPTGRAKKEAKKRASEAKKAEAKVGAGLVRGFALSDINMKIKRGELVAIVGAVGNGKTSLLSALIGDMEKERGSVHMHGTVAYAAQVAWIVNGTVRDNIVFGRAFDAAHYAAVLRACGLLPDLGVLRGGDMAEIGERGINLSGGQKQRISIARAAYSRADVVLLDDPLSAVDAHVGRHLLTQCLRGLLAQSTRLLVTNQLHVLPHTDRVIVLSKGRIVESGTYEELMSVESGELRGLMATYGHTGGEQKHDEGEHHEEDKGTHEGSKEEGKLVAEEERAQGEVSLRIYLKWFMAAGGATFMAIVAAGIIGSQTMLLLTDNWMTLWTRNMSGRPTAIFAGRDVNFYLAGYCLLGMLTQVFVVIRSLIFAFGSISASRSLHEKLLKGILRAKTSFFDATPIGRILNRFSKDMDQVDQYMTQSLESMLVCLADVFGILLMVCIVFPWFLVAFFPITIAYYWLQGFFRKTSRELQRIESTTRSPIYVQFSETLAGVSTIRCYGDQHRFIDRNKELVDLNNRSFLILQIANRWLQMRLELIGLVIMLSVSMLTVSQAGKTDPSLSGLILAYCLGIVMQMNWAARMAAETETRMTGVERILEYADPSIAEADYESAPDKKPPPEWPQRGEVRFEGLTMRYRPELPLVLDNVTLTVSPGEKVGIVGRTGSGKSTLMMALFRMAEAERGRIVIDGVDTAGLGLGELRRSLAIIPQDPVLFSQKLGGSEAAFGAVGGVRFNLDPLGRHDDAALWAALDAAQLGATVHGLANGLDAQVAEGGANFSVGQRQLLCLARALLRRPRVLVLDEATANVDTDTDTAIQRTLRTQLAQATVLTIAHRLHTVMDADKVLVMHRGTVAEYGRPADLLQNPTGMLTALVNDTGPASAARLHAIARGQLSVFDVLHDTAAEAPAPSPPTTDLIEAGVVPSDEQQFDTLVLDPATTAAALDGDEADEDRSRVAIAVDGGEEDEGEVTPEDGPVDASQVIEHMAPVMYSIETRSVRSMRLLDGEGDGVSLNSNY